MRKKNIINNIGSEIKDGTSGSGIRRNTVTKREFKTDAKEEELKMKVQKGARSENQNSTKGNAGKNPRDTEDTEGKTPWEHADLHGFTARTRTEWLAPDLLVMNPRIQRSLKTSRVDRIVRKYNPLLVNPIKVSHREGKYYVFDGQHTLAALKQLGGSELKEVECRVYEGLTYEIEARLFADQFGDSEAVSMVDRLSALEEAKDEKVLDFLAVTRGVGFTIDLSDSISRNGHIAAVCAAYAAYGALLGAEYASMLDIIKKTWGGESWSVTKNMIQGMTVFMNMYSGKKGGEVNTNKFVNCLRKANASDIRKRAETYQGMAIGTAYGIAIADYYEGNVVAA